MFFVLAIEKGQEGIKRRGDVAQIRCNCGDWHVIRCEG